MVGEFVYLSVYPFVYSHLPPLLATQLTGRSYVDEHLNSTIPEYQIPYTSRQMPIAHGFGTDALQTTFLIIGADDRSRQLIKEQRFRERCFQHKFVAKRSTHAAFGRGDRDSDLGTLIFHSTWERSRSNSRLTNSCVSVCFRY